MILGFTGMRPPKIGGYKIPNPIYNYVYKSIQEKLKELNPEKLICGMALGSDQIAAVVAYRLGIPFVAAVPFEGQETKWIAKDQEKYHKLLKKADSIVIVNGGGYQASKLQIRNVWIVDNCDKLLAVWDNSKGGTSNCVDYAKSVNRELIQIDPRNYEHGT